MEFLNKTYAQIVDLFRSMTPGARLTAGLLLAVIIVSVIYLFQFQAVGGGELLLGGAEFSQSEIRTMEAAFSAEGLGDSRVEGNRIRIPRGRKADYLAALASQNALPKNLTDIFDQALKDETWTTTRALRAQRLKLAREKLVSMVVSKMKGIQYSAVSFDEQKTGGLTHDVEKRAVAVVMPQGDRELTMDQVQSIRKTVSAFVAGLDRKNVTVSDLNGHTYAATDANGNPSAIEDPYASRKKMWEDWYRDKITNQLREIPKVLVGVNVQLDKTLNHQTQTLKYDKTGFYYDTQETTKNEKESAQPRGGRPGAAPNGVGPNTAAEIATGEAEVASNEETSSRQRGVTGNEVVTQEVVPMTPQVVSASIKVPSSYFIQLWRARQPADADKTPPSADDPAITAIRNETIKRIEDEVVAMLPAKPPGEDRYRPVVVKVYDDLPAPTIPEPTFSETGLTWLGENWPTLGMLLLGAASLFMLRAMFRAPRSDAPPASAEAGDSENSEEDDEADDEDGAESVARRRFASTGEDLQKELSEMVRENPDAAASVIRSWIGEAA